MRLVSVVSNPHSWRKKCLCEVRKCAWKLSTMKISASATSNSKRFSRASPLSSTSIWSSLRTHKSWLRCFHGTKINSLRVFLCCATRTKISSLKKVSAISCRLESQVISHQLSTRTCISSDSRCRESAKTTHSRISNTLISRTRTSPRILSYSNASSDRINSLR